MTSDALEFDPYSQVFFDDPYDVYRRLRDEAPVWKMPGTNTYVLTRYEDIHDVLRRTDVFMRGASESTPSSGASSLVKEIYATPPEVAQKAASMLR